MARITGARFHKHLVQQQELVFVWTGRERRIEFGKIESIFTGADLVEHLAQTENVRLWCARTFRRNVPFRADKRALTTRRDEPDVGQFRHTVYEDDVRRLDIAVGKTMPVQRVERFG